MAAIKARHSVRKYTAKDIPSDVVSALQKEIEECNKAGELNVQLVLNEPKAFAGLMSYGKFSGVENYLVMVGKKNDSLDERIGYYGERLVLLAQSLGLNSCWVGLTYRRVRDAFHVESGEKLVCVVALGYGAGSGSSHKIKSIQQVSNADDSTPSWFAEGVKAALLAPTAVNQQKFSFQYAGTGSDGKPKVKAKKGFSMVGYAQVDLGIAKQHFEIGAGKENFDWCE